MAALTADIIPDLVASRQLSTRVEHDLPSRFEIGDKVRIKNRNPITHTRIPGYTKGKAGVVHLFHGTFHFNDAVAHGLEDHQNCYSVKFTFRELWGDDYSETDYVYIDMFDEYLDEA